MKKIIAFIVILAVIFIGYFALSSKVEETVTVGSKPWIEVDNNNVNKVDEQGSVLGMFKSGDLLDSGMIIKTDATGAGTVYFSDGSNLRIDPNTTVKITEAEFDDDSGSLKVRVALSVGKVWSKITALATPDSLWEVRTGTAVATVRGSAFGTEVTADGQTEIIGSEHDVFVTPIDEETGEELADAKVTVGEKETLAIRKEIVEQIKNLTPEERKEKVTRLLARQLRGEDHPLRGWIERNEEHDGLIRERIEELKAEGLEGPALREELREVIKTELEPEFQARVEEISEKTGLPEDEIRQELDTRIETKLEMRTGTIETTQTDVTPKPAVISLEVRTRALGLKVTEGTTIEFEAIAVLSDGTKKIVTDLVSWQVVGSIGKLIKPGIFQAALGADVSEIGTAFGAVTASYKSESGKEFSGKSEIITVIGAVTPIDERG
ncbi:MAG: FecR domain-containing protein [Patescibacteria group bacterium]